MNSGQCRHRKLQAAVDHVEVLQAADLQPIGVFQGFAGVEMAGLLLVDGDEQLAGAHSVAAETGVFELLEEAHRGGLVLRVARDHAGEGLRPGRGWFWRRQDRRGRAHDAGVHTPV